MSAASCQQPHFLTQGQQLLELGRECNKPGHSLRFSGLRLKNEDKANISPDFNSYKLNWKMKEEKIKWGGSSCS